MPPINRMLGQHILVLIFGHLCILSMVPTYAPFGMCTRLLWPLDEILCGGHGAGLGDDWWHYEHMLTIRGHIAPTSPSVQLCSKGGGGRKKFLVPAYSFFFGGYPRRGGGGTKKVAQKNFPWGDPCTVCALHATFRLCSPQRAPRHAPWKYP